MRITHTNYTFIFYNSLEWISDIWKHQLLRVHPRYLSTKSGFPIHTSSVVGHPGVDDLKGSLRMTEVYLVWHALKCLWQATSEDFLQDYLSVHHYGTCHFHSFFTGQVSLKKPLLTWHSTICTCKECQKLQKGLKLFPYYIHKLIIL